MTAGRRKGVVVGEEENRRFIFSFSRSELVFARSTALNEEKKKTSVMLRRYARGRIYRSLLNENGFQF